DLVHHRSDHLTEACERLLGLPHVDDNETVGAVAGLVGEQPPHRPVARCLEPRLAAGETLDKPVVALPRERRARVDHHHGRHRTAETSTTSRTRVGPNGSAPSTAIASRSVPVWSIPVPRTRPSSSTSLAVPLSSRRPSTWTVPSGATSNRSVSKRISGEPPASRNCGERRFRSRTPWPVVRLATRIVPDARAPSGVTSTTPS